MNAVKLCEEALKEAEASNHRRIIVFCGRKYHEKVVCDSLEFCTKIYKKASILIVGDEKTLLLNEALEEVLKNRECSIKFLSFEKSIKALGTTWDFLVVDLRRDLTPNDIGRLIGIVRGGGLIFLLTPNFDSWIEMKTKFQERLYTYPYTLQDVKNNFITRFIRKLRDYEGIYIYDLDFDKPIKVPKGIFKKKRKRRKIEIPTKHEFPREIYEMCATQEQVEVLKLLENFIKDSGAFVLTANRGRGKSAVLGLFLACLAKVSKRRLRIGVTSPEKENVKTLFEFFERGLEKLNIKYYKNGYYEAKRIFVEYNKPYLLLNYNYDIAIVDEAAGIRVPLLYEIIKKFKKTIFSSTIHGYEGAGRGFSIRFLKGIKEKNMAKITEFKMEEPIRYASGDIIEKWLFDTLLLDAEPSEISDEDLKLIDRLKYEKPDVDEWFKNEKKERDLREFIGIYVLAHYRNRPNDLAVLADAPHHSVRVARLGNKIVNALQIAREGGVEDSYIDEMLKGFKPRGNIIPDVLTKHFRSREFAKLVGYRIVRIATHPKLMRHGIGSFMLNNLTKEALEKGFDWLGAGFGSSEELLRFWIKNEFVPVHLSFERNPISGEYSVIVVKPLSDRAEEIIKEMNYEFRLKFLGSVLDVQFDIEIEIAHLLLSTPYKYKPHYELKFTKTQIDRMQAYVDELLTYESVADVCRELARYYFLDTDRNLSLKDRQEKLLIAKCFLAKSWRKTSNLLDMKEGRALYEMRNIMKRLWKEYYAENSSDKSSD